MKNKFGIRTVLIPIFATFGFLMIQIAVAFIYVIIVMFFSGWQNIDLSNENQFMDYILTIYLQHSNIITIIYSVFVIFIALIVIRALSRSNPLAIRHERLPSGQLIAAVLLMLGVAGFVNLIVTGIQLLAEKYAYFERILREYMDGVQQFIIGNENIPLIIIATCILVPIAEDLIFRGIVQGELRRVMPGWTAVLVQGIIFSLIHVEEVQVIYVIVPALVLGAVYEWTKSIYAPIAMHMTFNLVGSVVTMFVQDMTEAGTVVSIAGFTADPNTIFFMTEIAMIPFAIVAMVFLYKRRRQDPPEPVAQQGPLDIPGAAPVYTEAVLDPAAWKHRDND